MPNVFLQALSSKVSDHCPLLLAGNADIQRFKGFRFESFWPRLQGYSDIVLAAWNRDLTVANPFLRLHTKLQRTSRALRRWARGLIGNNKLLIKAADQLIGILDVVQEQRQLSASELQLRRDLKNRLLGLTAVEKLRAKQASRLVSIRAAEANAKLFYIHANGRRRMNHISLQTAQGTCFWHEAEAASLFEHYSNHFGTPGQRDHTLNWEQLWIATHDLAHLEDNFTEEELRAVIQDIAAEKARGPDGYIGTFLSTVGGRQARSNACLGWITFTNSMVHFAKLNTAHLVLLPKKPDAKWIGDFRPISFTHSIGKIFSKLLATRLAPELN